MQRYLLVFSADPAACEAAVARVNAGTAMAEIVTTPRLRLLASRTLLWQARDGDAQQGILGSLATGATRARPAQQDGLAGDFFQSLVQETWGTWLGLAREGCGDNWWIARDPSGALPCYWSRRGEMIALGSHPRDILKALDTEQVVDAAVLAAHLLRPAHRSTQTCLAGVVELLPGFALRIAPMPAEADSVPIWSPWDHVSGRADRSEAADLAAVIDATVQAMVHGEQGVLLSLSGGLDSSVLTASLARAGGPVSCLNLATPSGRGDERSFARAVAAMHELPLREWLFEVSGVDIARTTWPWLPRPNPRLYAQQSDRIRADLAARDGFAIMTGDGGDNVFCLLQSATPLVDRWRAEGMGRGAWATLLDLCHLTRAGIPTVLMAALRKARRGMTYRWPLTPAFLSREAVVAASQMPWHPWLTPPSRTLPGNLAHIALLVRGQTYHEAYADGRSRVLLPLLAQPVMETCLAIASWEWCAGGRNRAPVRAAFAERLPAIVSERRSKGGPEDHCLALVREKRQQLTERLGQGLLAGWGILDRAAISACLALPEIPAADAHRLLALVEAENWAREWSA